MNHKLNLFDRAKSAGTGLLQQESKLANVMSRVAESKLPVSEIKPRRNPSSRQLDPEHVLRMADTIIAVGLIEALAVDVNHHLLAGGHRLCALQLLAEQPNDRAELWTTTFGSAPDQKTAEHLEVLPVGPGFVPVNVIPMDSDADRSMALAIEIAENERRRNFSREEVRGLAERLKTAGFRTERGRARAGEMAVIPALSAVLGKSRATVFRMLRDDAETSGATSLPTRTSNSSAEDLRLLKALRRWLTLSPASEHRESVSELIRMLGTSAS